MEDRYLYRYIHFKTRASAGEKDITSLKNWFYNHDGAIMPEERTYIDKNDLFALVPKDRSPLRRFFERSSHFRLFKLWRQKPHAEQEASNIAEWLSGKVAYHKKLRGGVHFIDQTPKSATGKVLRRVLKEQAKKEATSKAKL
ncbi:hypothetical protein ATERTT37_006303 [Aspergillus terreus]